MQKQKRTRKNISSNIVLESSGTPERNEVDGYYFDGKDSYVLRKTSSGKSSMELQAEKITK
jgi:hypothetical protein